jgi:hypothetical protein
MRAKKMKYLVIAAFLLALASSGFAQSASPSNNIQSTYSNNMKKLLRQMDKEFANMRKFKGGNFKSECAAPGVQGYVLLVKVVLAAHRAPVVLAATVSSLADEK